MCNKFIVLGKHHNEDLFAVGAGDGSWWSLGIGATWKLALRVFPSLYSCFGEPLRNSTDHSRNEAKKVFSVYSGGWLLVDWMYGSKLLTAYNIDELELEDPT